MFDALRTHVVGPLACMTPKNILDHIVLVQLVLVIELWVVSFAFIEEGLQLWDVVRGLRSSKRHVQHLYTIIHAYPTQQFRL